MNLLSNRRSMSMTTRTAHKAARLRCMTLLEVLIALVLLAALAAIVAPSVLNRLDERAFEAAADNTSEQLMMARAHAQATGEAVEVTYSPTTGQVQARMYAPWSKEIEFGRVEPGTSPLMASAQRTASAEGADETEDVNRDWSVSSDRSRADSESINPIAEGWASRALGRGIRIGTHRPMNEAGAANEAVWCDPQTGLPLNDHQSDGETLEDLANGQEVRLAVFMPDGSAMVGENLWLNDDGGRCGRISINPWSGLPMFQRLSDLTDEALGASGRSSKNDAIDESSSTSDDAMFPTDAFPGESDSPDDRQDD